MIFSFVVFFFFFVVKIKIEIWWSCAPIELVEVKSFDLREHKTRGEAKTKFIENVETSSFNELKVVVLRLQEG
jgi:hypothetical protein